ncbi:MAG: ABC transporter permease [Nitrospinae bacterium]|nr:ABC transporter permease [Nitrospinota bacterium]
MAQQTDSFASPLAARFISARRKFDASTVVWGTIAAILLILIVKPVYHLAKQSFLLPEEDGGGWTLLNYFTAFTEPEHYYPIFSTLYISFSVGILSLILGAIIAWCISRTDVPFPNLLRNSVLMSFVTPPFLGAIAWIFLAGPRQGWINIIYRAITGAGPDDYLVDIFTVGGMVFAMTLYTFPLVFIVVLAGLNNVSSDIEDAANIAGGGTFSTMINVTLPLVMPALVAGLILGTLEAMILFGIPAVLGLPAGNHVMTTQLRAFMSSDEDMIGIAAAYSLPMLMTAFWLVYMRRHVLGRRGYATLGGKGGQRRPQRLGPWRYPVFILCSIPVLCAIVLPYFMLTTTSFLKTIGHGLSLSNLTFDNYIFIFNNDAVRISFYNTIMLALMAATAATLIAAVTSYITQRNLVRGHKYMSFLATAPIGIPGIVLAVGLFSAYTQEPFLLYGTIWIMFIAYVTKYLPLAFQTSNASLMSIHPELEECSRILGASRLQVFKDVTIPLFKAGLLASWILVFMPSLRELSASILLYTSETKVVSVMIITFYEEALLGAISAIGVILLAITSIAVLIGYKVVGRDFMRSE